jgi:hypothetical protein
LQQGKGLRVKQPGPWGTLNAQRTYAATQPLHACVIARAAMASLGPQHQAMADALAAERARVAELEEQLRASKQLNVTVVSVAQALRLADHRPNPWDLHAHRPCFVHASIRRSNNKQSKRRRPSRSN